MPETPNLPDMTKLAEAAASLHEVFSALIRAGFSEAQACRIVAGIMTGGTT